MSGAVRLAAGRYRHAATGRAWLVTREGLAGGRAVKIAARELGAPGFMSMNLYRTRAGWRLFPCEATTEDAEALIAALLPGSGDLRQGDAKEGIQP